MSSKAEGAEEILKELWAVKDAYAKRFNYDLGAIFEDQLKLGQKLRQEGYRLGSIEDRSDLKGSPERAK